MTAPLPHAVVSCDVDPVDVHLQGYGISDARRCDLVYRRALPRILRLLDEVGIRAVFFLVARDAVAQRETLRSLVARGHEVASHSMNHPVPFRTLDDRTLAREIADSRLALGAASGADVVGFRAPAWDVDARVLTLIRRCGYRYDASIFPSPVLLANRVAVYWRGTHRRSLFSMNLFGHAFASVQPRACTGGAQGLMEFPIAVTRHLRLPVYHTLSHMLPATVFRRVLRAGVRSPYPLSYQFHGADLLDLDDGLDERLARHPGIAIPVERKIAALRDVLTTITRHRTVRTYRDLLDDQAQAA
jgi:hypothetical protein